MPAVRYRGLGWQPPLMLEAGCGGQWTGLSGGVLQIVEQVRALSQGDATAGYQVRLTGHVTYSDGGWKLLFVQDPTGGVRVEALVTPPGLHVGQTVEVTGRVDSAVPTPLVTQAMMRVLDSENLPPPVILKMTKLAASELVFTRVEIEGVVHSPRMSTIS